MIELDTARFFNRDHQGYREVSRYLNRKGLRLTHDGKIIARNFKVVAYLHNWTDGTQCISRSKRP